MALNSTSLEAFSMCAQTGNFTKAANRLHITQSALSQRIKNLEEELGVTLIIRDRAGLRLTELGSELLRYCQMKEQLESQFTGSIRKSGSENIIGIIRIGGFSSVMRSVILPALSSLLKSNPHIRIKMITREIYELLPLLKSGEIDFLILPENLNQEALVTKVLGYEENVMVQSRSNKGAQIYLDHDEEDDSTLQYLGRKQSSKIERQYLDDIYGIIDGVKLGLGRAVVPKHLIEHDRDIEIIESKNSKSPVVLHYYNQPVYSKLHQVVVNALVGNCRKFLGAL